MEQQLVPEGFPPSEPPVTAAQIEALLPFLAAFELEGCVHGQWHAPEGQFGYYAYSEVVTAFIRALYEGGWVIEFDWVEWQDQAEQIVVSLEGLDKADAATIRRLLTLHARKDRFCEGHLAGMLDSGHVLALLRRLREIRVDIPGPLTGRGGRPTTG